MASNLSFEPVGPGDLIYLSVSDAPELTRSYRVSAGGKLILPLLQRPIEVAGMLPTDVEKIVSHQLTADRILVSPVVSVAVLDYRSRMVNVVGSVKRPVNFQAVGNMKLLDAIARADGLAPDAGPEILVFAPGQETRHIPVKLLMGEGAAALNIPLKGGEEIRVPEAPKLYVVGNVKLPGVYPLNELGGSSVLKALALCQGTLPYSQKQVFVYRTVPGAVDRKEIGIPLNDIMNRKAPDFPLQANDILYIPDNSKKRMTAGVIDRIAGFGGATVSGLVIWRH